MAFFGLAPAAVATGCVWLLAKRGKASPIDKGLTTFVLLGAAAHWLWPSAPARAVFTYPMTWLYVILFAVAVGPQLLGRAPFTAFFARQRAPEAVWETSVFRDIVRRMAWTWAGLFALAGVSTLLPDLAPSGIWPTWMRHIFTDVLPILLMLGVGVPFNRLYPAYHQRRLGLEPALATPSTQPGPPPNPGRPVSSPRPVNEPPRKEKTMSSAKQIVAINGSPHQGIGNTSQMVAMLKPHLEAAGCELEEIFLAEKEIKFCTGCGLCLEKGACWIRDDHREVASKMLAADAVILATPVYFFHVTAQMKTFLDRSLPYGHKPRGTWKPGLAVAVSAGMGETSVAEYLGNVLRAYGSYSVGSLTAIAVGPGEFLGKEAVASRAADLARDLARAVHGQRRYPATDRDLLFWQFMGNLVKENRGFMKHDYEHWQEHGLLDSFESYVQQQRSEPIRQPEARKAWLDQMIARQRDELSGAEKGSERPAPAGPAAAATCRELLAAMPQGFHPAAAEGLRAVYQFEVEDEGFAGHLDVADGTCTFHEGRAAEPDVVIRTPSRVWLAIARGELDGQQAFMTGQYRVDGDIGRLIKLGELFG
jgi:multimeric flavodoxin WrbA/putative sterol carrier protein